MMYQKHSKISALFFTCTMMLLSISSMTTQAATSIISPSRLLTKTGSTDSKPLSVLTAQEQEGSANERNTYKVFKSNDKRYRGIFVFNVSSLLDSQNMTSINLHANYRGLSKRAQQWTWRIRDFKNKRWEPLGDNRQSEKALWNQLSFPIEGDLSRFVNKKGELRVEYKSNIVNRGGRSALDFMALVIAHQDDDDQDDGDSGSGDGTGLEKGMGIWAYVRSDSERTRTIDYIKDLNSKVKESKKIKYLYLSAGGIESYDDNINGKYNSAYLYDKVDVGYFKNNLPGVKIHVMFEGDSATANNLKNLPDSELKTLAQDIADLANNNDNIDGVHFDIEPFRSGQGKLIEYTQEYLNKPLGAALGSFTDDGFFAHLDIPVIMNYDQCVSDLNVFTKVTKKRADEFFELCRKYDNPNCHYGLAAVKSWCEPDDIDYYKASYDVFKGYDNESLGLTLYGLFTGENPYPNQSFMDILIQDYKK